MKAYFTPLQNVNKLAQSSSNRKSIDLPIYIDNVKYWDTSYLWDFKKYKEKKLKYMRRKEKTLKLDFFQKQIKKFKLIKYTFT